MIVNNKLFNEHELDLYKLRINLLGDLLYFIQFFYYQRTGRNFSLSSPIGRKSHHIIICKELSEVFFLNTLRLSINIPPGHFKSTLLQHFIAFCWAHYPDCKFLYISHTWDEAVKNTSVIQDIIRLPIYRKLFGVTVHPNFRAKDDFRTTGDGGIIAYGSDGSMTGKDAGFPDCSRISGALIMDDMHKISDARSKIKREKVILHYKESFKSRLRGPLVPQINLGQRTHQFDISDYFIEGGKGLKDKDGDVWKCIILPALDNSNNVLDPNIRTFEQLETLKIIDPYTYFSQYQQKPVPDGGGMFKKEHLRLLEHEPKILVTFITCDTAETDKTYNDKTVFTHWGIYKIYHYDIDTGMYGLHCLDCQADWISVENLEDELRNFYFRCMTHPIKIYAIAIEKKSSGVTLGAAIKKIQGFQTIQIDRTRASGSKTTRYAEMIPYIAKGQISFTKGDLHAEMCIEHIGDITDNGSHGFDDIADTFYDAVKLVFIDHAFDYQLKSFAPNPAVVQMQQDFNRIEQLRAKSYARRS